MIDIQQLIDSDKQLLLTLNGSESLFWDGVMVIISSTYTWIPLLLAFIYFLLKNNSTKNFFFILLMIALAITLTDGISSSLCKPFFARFRPTQDPQLMYMIDTVDGYRGGLYGFMSSHAANTFGVALFTLLLIKNKAYSLSILLWALLNSYSRIYLGVHYPGDVLCGALLGATIGALSYLLYNRLKKRKQIHTRSWISDNYTQSGYAVADVRLLIMILYGTFATIPILSLLYQHIHSL